MEPELEGMESDFLTARRYGKDEIIAQQAAVGGLISLEALYELPLILFVVNDLRQIVWMNARAESLVSTIETGQRPGEALGCIHACERPGGCGTSKFCAYCGAPAAIMEALAGAVGSKECVIERRIDRGIDTLDLLVWSKPVGPAGSGFVLFAARDMSAEKRHESLEHIFYHDIGNTASGIHAMLELIDLEGGERGAEYLRYLRAASEQLVEEIESQRALKAAESGTLRPEDELVDPNELIERALGLFDYAALGKDIGIERAAPAPGLYCVCDPALARRVIVNMIKNAVEASGRGDTIRIGCAAAGERCEISVWNRAEMGAEAKMRVFQRSFSTKGRGRGMGTYGMKLLAERYLGATVRFSSEPGRGTTFVLSLPTQRDD